MRKTEITEAIPAQTGCGQGPRQVLGNHDTQMRSGLTEPEDISGEEMKTNHCWHATT